MLLHLRNDVVRRDDLRKVTEAAHPREELRTDYDARADGEVSITVGDKHHIISVSRPNVNRISLVNLYNHCCTERIRNGHIKKRQKTAESVKKRHFEVTSNILKKVSVFKGLRRRKCPKVAKKAYFEG